MPIPSKVGARPRILRRDPAAPARWTIPAGGEGGRRETPRHLSGSSAIIESIVSLPRKRAIPIDAVIRHTAKGTEREWTPSERAAIMRALDAHPSDLADALPCGTGAPRPPALRPVSDGVRGAARALRWIR